MSALFLGQTMVSSEAELEKEKSNERNSKIKVEVGGRNGKTS